MNSATQPEALVKFHAVRISLQLIRLLRPLVEKVRRKSPKLADQIEEAASSTPANLAEGRRRIGRDRVQRFRIADGSADEVKTHLLTAIAWGWIDEQESAAALACSDELLAITWTLTH
jgi:four helix bundle protein